MYHINVLSNNFHACAGLIDGISFKIMDDVYLEYKTIPTRIRGL